MGGLEGRTALVVGGTGKVGREVARAFLRGGAARVLVPSRGEEALGALRGHLGGDADRRLVPVVADLSTAEGLGGVSDRLAALGGALDAVVASVNSRGGWGKGLLETGDDAWRSVLEGGLTLHFRVARAFLPFLAGREGASYTFINGGLAETPTPGVGPVCASAAGQLMLARVLAAETEGSGVRVNTLLVNSVVRDGEPGDAGGGERHPERATAGEVGRAAAFLASPAGAFLRGATIAVNQMPPERPDAVASLGARRPRGAPA